MKDLLNLLNSELTSKELGFLSSIIETTTTFDSKLFSEDELEFLLKLEKNEISAESLRPHTFMIMKSTRLCNLRCTYCHSWREGPNQSMSFEVLATSIRTVLLSNKTKVVDFIWHGGETTVLNTQFYRRAIELQNKYKKVGQTINNSIQTNGYKLSEEWFDFLKTHSISVGVSLDGPEEIHDTRRLSVGGKPTFNEVKKTLIRLQDENIQHGILMVVDETIMNYSPKNLLKYFNDLGVSNIALLNVLPENKFDSEISGMYSPFDKYVSFLIELFNEWFENYNEKIFIREFQSLVDQVNGKKPGICIFAGNCLGQFLTIDPNGDISACDKYIDLPEYKFGNVLDGDLGVPSENLKTERVFVDSQSNSMNQCENFLVCNGGCPHDNYLNSKLHGINSPKCCGLKPLIEVIKSKSLINN